MSGCPLRGRTCADLAAGEFPEHIATFLEVATGKLEVGLRARQLEASVLRVVLLDFERGRSHLIT
eukprot:4338867-Prorocentrum_lima.AAC.1